MLRLEKINVTLGKGTKLKRKVLDGLNLTLQEGEWAVIIGGNGAGKSTLFQVISGLMEPDSGKVWIQGQDDGTSRAKLISSVMQDPKMGTMENLSLFENMAFALKRGQTRGLHFFGNKKRTQIFKENLRLLNMGLEDRLHEPVSHLSGGQRQMLSLVMAMLQKSKILLLDEITAALDPASSEATMALTHEMVRAQKLSCLMITHNMTHALQYGDRLLLLKNGVFIKEYDGAVKSKLTPFDLACEFGDIL